MFSKIRDLSIGGGLLACLCLAFPGVSKGDPDKYLSGPNFWGRPGLLVGDDFERFEPGTWMVSANFMYQSTNVGDELLAPLGLDYMVTRDLNCYVGASFKDYPAQANGLGLLIFGAQYGLMPQDSAFQCSLGLDVSTGPFSNSLGSSTTDFVPTGIVSYLFSGVLFNFELGVYLPGGGWPTYIRFDPGVAYPLAHDLTALFEIGGHQMGGPTNPGSSVVAGLRLGSGLQGQWMFGLGTSDAAPHYYTGLTLSLMTR